MPHRLKLEHFDGQDTGCLQTVPKVTNQVHIAGIIQRSFTFSVAGQNSIYPDNKLTRCQSYPIDSSGAEGATPERVECIRQLVFNNKRQDMKMGLPQVFVAVLRTLASVADVCCGLRDSRYVS